MTEQDSDTLSKVIAMMRSREQVGRAKYGVTLDRTDLDLRAWLTHMFEELLDGANYAQRALDMLDGKVNSPDPPDYHYDGSNVRMFRPGQPEPITHEIDHDGSKTGFPGASLAQGTLGEQFANVANVTKDVPDYRLSEFIRRELQKRKSVIENARFVSIEYRLRENARDGMTIPPEDILSVTLNIGGTRMKFRNPECES